MKLHYIKRCWLRYGHSQGIMQCRRSCKYSCSIHDYVVPTAVCTHVLYALIVTVQLSFLSDRLEHPIHPRDSTHHTPHTHRVKCRAKAPRLKILSSCILFPIYGGPWLALWQSALSESCLESCGYYFCFHLLE